MASPRVLSLAQHISITQAHYQLQFWEAREKKIIPLRYRKLSCLLDSALYHYVQGRQMPVKTWFPVFVDGVAIRVDIICNIQMTIPQKNTTRPTCYLQKQTRGPWTSVLQPQIQSNWACLGWRKTFNWIQQCEGEIPFQSTK
jgi:hypothetical protein